MIPVQVLIGDPVYPGAPDGGAGRPPLWRVKHDRELGPLWRPGLPEVHPFFPNHHVPFPESWQRYSFGMNTMNAEKWTSVYSYKIAFTNGQGFGDPDDPRANHIMREHLREELPKVEALVCGGAVLTGVVSGDNLIVSTLNGRDDPPRRALAPWEQYHAVTVDSHGTPRLFPQGGGRPVILPLVADRNRFTVVTFPMSKLERVPDNAPIPSPYL